MNQNIPFSSKSRQPQHFQRPQMTSNDSGVSGPPQQQTMFDKPGFNVHERPHSPSSTSPNRQIPVSLPSGGPRQEPAAPFQPRMEVDAEMNERSNETGFDQPEPVQYSASPKINKKPPPFSKPVKTGLQPPEQKDRERSVSPAPQNLTPMELITMILKESVELEKQVSAFNSTKQDKQYLFLEEMLTRKLLKLDNIDSAGDDAIRNERRKAVKLVQGCLDQLELKAFSNEQQPTGEQPQAVRDEPAGNNYNQSTNNAQSKTNEKSESIGNKTHVKEMVLDSEISC